MGDAFVDWYNSLSGTAYAYRERGAEPPDLIYAADRQDLPLEITVAYDDPGRSAIIGTPWWTDADSSAP